MMKIILLLAGTAYGQAATPFFPPPATCGAFQLTPSGEAKVKAAAVQMAKTKENANTFGGVTSSWDEMKAGFREFLVTVCTETDVCAVVRAVAGWSPNLHTGATHPGSGGCETVIDDSGLDNVKWMNCVSSGFQAGQTGLGFSYCSRWLVRSRVNQANGGPGCGAAGSSGNDCPGTGMVVGWRTTTRYFTGRDSGDDYCKGVVDYEEMQVQYFNNPTAGAVDDGPCTTEQYNNAKDETEEAFNKVYNYDEQIETTASAMDPTETTPRSEGGWFRAYIPPGGENVKETVSRGVVLAPEDYVRNPAVEETTPRPPEPQPIPTASGHVYVDGGVIGVTNIVEVEVVNPVEIADGELVTGSAPTYTRRKTFQQAWDNAWTGRTTPPVFALVDQLTELEVDDEGYQDTYCFTLARLGTHCIDLGGAGFNTVVTVIAFFVVAAAFIASFFIIFR